MSFLKSLPPDAALLNVFKLFPTTAKPLIEYHEVLLRGPSPLTVAERELIAGYVSGLNACNYCHGVHEATAREFGIPDGLMVQLMDDPGTASVSEKMKPILLYVRKLTLSPSKMTQGDAAAIFAAGWDEQALHDAVSTCALFNFMNRFVEGHGIKAGPEYFSLSAKRLHDGGYSGLLRLLGLNPRHFPSPIPNAPVPALELGLAGGGRFSLAAENPQHFTMVVFYRGLHCPICRRYLTELEGLLPEFTKRGVAVLAASSDPQDRAEKAKADWGLANLRVGYGLSIENARAWGLYISRSKGPTSAGIVEPELFNEPGLFMVRPDGALYWGTISTMPFGRPHFNEILQSLDFVISKNYPARGDA